MPASGKSFLSGAGGLVPGLGGLFGLVGFRLGRRGEHHAFPSGFLERARPAELEHPVKGLEWQSDEAEQAAGIHAHGHVEGLGVEVD